MADDVAGYDFFLSYSHRDRDIARGVVHALRRLAVPWYRRSRRRVFRDDLSLAAGGELEADIRDALARSRALVVLLSRATRERGEWITKEVTWWSELGQPADCLIFVVIEGRFEEVLPEALRPAHGGGERTHVDVSAQVARRRPPRNRSIAREMAAVVAVLSPGRNREAIYDEARRQYRRMILTLTAFVTAVIVAVGVGAVVIIRESQAANSASQAAAEQNRQRYQATVAATVQGLDAQAEQLGDQDPQLALRLAVAADVLRRTPDTTRDLVSTLVVDRPMVVTDTGAGVIPDLALSPDGRQALVGDATAQMWAITPTSATMTATLARTSGTIGAVAMLTNTMAIVGNGGDAAVYDATRSTLVARFPRTANTITRIDATADGHTVVVVNLDGEAQVYDMTDPATPVLRQSLGTVAVPGSADLAANGSLLAVGSDLDYRAELFDLRSRASRPVLVPAHFTKPISTVALSADSRRLAVAGEDGRITLWDTADPTAPGLIASWAPGIQQALAFSPDGRYLASGGQDGQVAVWNIQAPAGPSRIADLPLHSGAVTAVTFTPDGHTLWTGGEDGVLSAVRLNLLPGPAQTAVLRDASADVFAAAYRPGTAELVTGGNDLPVEHWDAAVPQAPRRLTDLPAPRDQVATIAWNHDGTRLALGDGRQVIVTNATGGGQTRFTADSSLVTFVAFTPDSRYLVTDGNDHRVEVRTIAGTPIRTIAAGADAIAMSSAGVLAVSPDTRHVQLIDLGRPTDPRPVGGPLLDQGDLIYGAAFSPDDKRLALAGRNHQASLWSLDTTATPALLGGFTDSASTVAFSTDGRLLAVGSFDRSVRIWAVGGPYPPLLVATVKDQRDYVMAVAFSSTRQLATAGRDGQVLIYDTGQLDRDVTDPLAQACSLAGGGLDRAQWARYLPAEIGWRQTC